MEPSIAPQADLDLPARVIYGEARGEPEIGQVALAWVIKTRAEWPGGAWWGKTPAEVCADPFQFSCMNDSDPNKRKLLTLPITDPHYTRLSDLFADVLAGRIPDPTDGATHYKVTGTKASWDSAVAERGIEPTIIGNHSFYRIGPH